MTPGRSASRRPSRSAPTTTTARWPRAFSRSAPTCSSRALDERPPCAEQSEEGATYAEKITAEDRTLDPAAPAEVNERIVRALHPHIGARLPLPDGSFLGVSRARVGEDGSLELVEVQPPGGRPMSYADYRRGHR